MKKVLKISLIITAILMLICTTIAIIFITNIMKETQSVEFNKNKLITVSKQLNIYDNVNNLISETAYNGQTIVSINDLSEDTINCFLSIEDKKFYEHQGLNYKRIAKAMINNLKSRSFKEGASTISQQLIKNTHLTNEKTIKRKVKEMILTKKLEKAFTKNEILETYLNVIYFGHNCYGIEEASKYYFNKSASELNLEESALLAGMIKAPSHYSPINNPETALKRRNLVLMEMMEDGNISDEEYYNAKQKDIVLNVTQQSMPDMLYLKAVKNEAETLLNIPAQQIALRDYKIYTYYDETSQKALENSLDNENYYHINQYGNIADSLATVINNSTGGIEALYGKSKYDLSNVKRQPGSAIKPILVYAPALDKGEIHNCSQILDEKVDYSGYSPNNVGNIFHGYTSVRDCVADSLNIPAIKVMDYVGINNCKQFAQKAGIEFNEYDNGFAIALGGFNEGILLTDLTASYIPFACNGNYIKSGFIRKITTSDDIVIYERDESKHQIMGDDTAYLMTDLLINGVKNGTSKRLKDLPYEVAGKTGTVAVKNTNLNTDVYSIAYTTEHSIGVWLGNYSFDKEHNLEGCNNGGTYCTSMVKDILNTIYSDHSPNNFEMPDSVIELSIDEKNLLENHTIKLAGDNCPERYQIKEIFAKRFVPSEVSDLYTNFDIDFNVSLVNNVAQITLNALDYLIYDIYVDDELIESIQNKSGEISFDYNKLKSNTMYNFYVDVRNNYSDTVIKSKTISIYTKNLYDNLILDNEVKQLSGDNLNWYFY